MIVLLGVGQVVLCARCSWGGDSRHAVIRRILRKFRVYSSLSGIFFCDLQDLGSIMVRYARLPVQSNHIGPNLRIKCPLDASHALPAVNNDIGAYIEVTRSRSEKYGRPCDIVLLPYPLGWNYLLHLVCMIPGRLIQISREVAGGRLYLIESPPKPSCLQGAGPTVLHLLC